MPDPLAEAPRLVRFGVFELDVRSGDLRKSGVRLNLPDQPLQILSALLERPGEIVTRDELRQRLWPSDTFVDFEHGLNAAVKRLRDVLGDAADTPRFIETVPKRGYRFVASLNGNGPEQASASSGPRQTPEHPLARVVRTSRWTWRGLGAAALLVLVIAIYRGAADDVAMRVVPLTTLVGSESAPTFSPDGEQVAFSWNGENQDNDDIYVMLVGSSDVRRLTSDAAIDAEPRWSPDGKQIAFLRCREGEYGCRIHLTSPIGGSDRKLSDFPACRRVAWSPDSRFFAVNRVPGDGARWSGATYLLAADGREVRRLTATEAPAYDLAPALSPDGRRLAYVSCRSMLDCHLELQELSNDLAPIGLSRRLTSEPAVIVTVDWSPTGDSVVYETQAGAYNKYLWRLSVDGATRPERIELAGVGARDPAVASSSHGRLAFSRSAYDTDIYRFTVDGTSERVIGSTVADLQPASSPDGQRIAFCSVRGGGVMEVWTAARDGSGAQQLTHDLGRWQCSPHWSPDGRRIAFDAQDADGRSHLWIVDADGGVPHQATRDEYTQTVPSWSRDGRWIYFWSDRGGIQNIWRVPASGGSAEPVTRDGAGGLAQESLDGLNVVYESMFESNLMGSRLMTVSVHGGPARVLVPCARAEGAFAVAAAGIYYLGCGTDPSPPLHLLDPATGQDRVLGRLERFVGPAFGLAVSPDGRSVLYNKVIGDGADLMLIENFK